MSDWADEKARSMTADAAATYGLTDYERDEIAEDLAAALRAAHAEGLRGERRSQVVATPPQSTVERLKAIYEAEVDRLCASNEMGIFKASDVALLAVAAAVRADAAAELRARATECDYSGAGAAAVVYRAAADRIDARKDGEHG